MPDYTESRTPANAGLGDTVMTTEDWLAKHREHGDLTIENSVCRGRWLICECGAKHLAN